MKIGIIGAGNIGLELARKLSKAGHAIKLANSRGPESLADVVKDTDIKAATGEDAGKDADVVILSLPFNRNLAAAELLKHTPATAIIIDTSNYYPARDGHIDEVDAGEPETLWVSKRIRRPLLKAWNALLSSTLREAGLQPSESGRIAIPIAGDDVVAKDVLASLVSETGFDSVDAGTLGESWRFQPGAPAYCTELTRNELEIALASAVKGRVPANRDAIMKVFTDGPGPSSRRDLVQLNRTMSL
ncbi:tartronate semialdehyde reductase [Caballeronia fortuita]|uniref:Tartronate semialdehyde reductase n=1 Tax=Caballeronia fortuita TaxID=1777138 RepID=A0A158A716_9BURK|nr:NAD(P)-binding domain-containing protein [Caballeronia fortuita]SAK53563.1 tartronate semialdehyde reductase [Caballeronia fortuita]